MEATPVAGSAEPDFGTTTIVVHQLTDRAQKLLRIRHLKTQLRDLRTEHDQLQEELFGQAAP